MPKDNEKISQLDTGLVLPSETPAFPADLMVGCEDCLRANPPTRVNCIYCGAILPVTEQGSRLQKPTLRRLETFEHGFNCILVPTAERSLTPPVLAEACELLRLGPDDLQRIIAINQPLPLARAATEDEAALIFRRLSTLGLETFTVPDEQLINDSLVRIRAASFQETGIRSYQSSGMTNADVLFSEITLLVVGRLFVKRVEVKERKSRRAEDDIVNASQFFTDAAVLDIHTAKKSWRIEAINFDFSLLGARKSLVTGENLNTLVSLVRESAPHAELDDSYASLRQALEPVWPSEQRTQAIGWHRERPGRYSTSGATETCNENQFTRYSCLRHYLKLNPIAHSR